MKKRSSENKNEQNKKHKSTKGEQVTIFDLPLEALVEISQHFSSKDVVNVCLVSKSLLNLFSLSIRSFVIRDVIDDKGIKFISDHFNNLTQLMIPSNSKITDESFKYISKLTKLVELDLTDCEEITDVAIEHIQNLKGLKWLSISECDSLTGKSFTLIANSFKQLEYLNISECQNFETEELDHLEKTLSSTEVNY
eukprot:TRINITY_DN7051_c0_g1_i1.p1 TRINITY_DN7051_c0_g1~~TRINITY_DN7051_c0_g1_i1.p1  ORF type:complete len:195 (-),score=10.49 TRINITY_DN7051_c0_g1_i1:125-709(-)